MSGCPVFAFWEKPGRDVQVMVCAMQTSWIPTKAHPGDGRSEICLSAAPGGCQHEAGRGLMPTRGLSGMGMTEILNEYVAPF